MPYIVLNKGAEYNDEIYSIGGDDAKVCAQLFESFDEAKDKLRELAREDFAKHEANGYDGNKFYWGFRVGEFSYDGDEPGWNLMEILNQEEVSRDFWDGDYYGDLIERADAAGIDWLKYIPQLYEIVEVYYND